MRPTGIPEILDLAVEARKQGLILNPRFVGEAGIGKSMIARKWVKAQQAIDSEFGMIDLRIAYYEAPDMIGFPKEVKDEKTGEWRTIHCLPDFWPTSGRGLIMLEEPSRGTTGVMNTLMQLLTDREVGPHYELPDGWIIASFDNPDSANYDTNGMDTALTDRFETFPVDFDMNGFMNYIEPRKDDKGNQIGGWHKNVVNFIKSGQWVYKTPDAISTEGQYISPRTLQKMNNWELAGASINEAARTNHRTIAQAVLGKHIGNEYWKSCWDDAPILASDLIMDMEKSLKKIKKHSKKGDAYSGDKVSVTIGSIIENYDGFFEGRKDKNKADWPCAEGHIDEATMVAVAKVIPSDLAINLIKGCGYKAHKGEVNSYFKEFYKRNEDCVAIMRGNIKLNRALKNK